MSLFENPHEGAPEGVLEHLEISMDEHLEDYAKAEGRPMNLDEFRTLAFAKYLSRLNPEDAIAHLYECLRNSSEEDNLGWELMTLVHGEKYDITASTLHAAIEALKENA